MKDIYARAKQVLVWLGPAADNSNTAMDFLVASSFKRLQPKGREYARAWTRSEVAAVLSVFERAYWRRIWIIREIVHAQKVYIPCGDRHFHWSRLERFYHKLKTIAGSLGGWQKHHELGQRLLRSPACTMVSQRAHWRHPNTPRPMLRSLIATFKEWECSDVKDKVYGLLALADAETDVVADYSNTVEGTYRAVCKSECLFKFRKVPKEVKNNDAAFCRLLRRILGLA
ncbi:hypothetical protein DL770_010939 [Monosporascus sp. CRB-9-2]|nr:hypothetical protein DL770_010939 [Monosporascus sp. CRB-9-2]